MSTEKIDIKVLGKLVIDKRNEGKTNQEIYNELRTQYDDKKSIAVMIVGTTTHKLKEKHKLLNNTLLWLISMAILLHTVSLILAVPTLWTEDDWILFLAFIEPLLIISIGVYSIVQISKFNYHGYLASIGYAAISLMKLIDLQFGKAIVPGALSFALIVGLSFYLFRKIFPNSKPWGGLKKDSYSEYILD